MVKIYGKIAVLWEIKYIVRFSYSMTTWHSLDELKKGHSGPLFSTDLILKFTVENLAVTTLFHIFFKINTVGKKML